MLFQVLQVCYHLDATEVVVMMLGNGTDRDRSDTGEAGGAASHPSLSDTLFSFCRAQGPHGDTFPSGHKAQEAGSSGRLGHLRQVICPLWASAALPVTWAEAASLLCVVNS